MLLSMISGAALQPASAVTSSRVFNASSSRECHSELPRAYTSAIPRILSSREYAGEYSILSLALPIETSQQFDSSGSSTPEKPTCERELQSSTHSLARPTFEILRPDPMFKTPSTCGLARHASTAEATSRTST